VPVAGFLALRVSLLGCNGRASVVLSQAESALDVRNDEFGLCEVNNAKMDCYPEHARYRTTWYVDGRETGTTGPPAEMTPARRPPTGEIVRCRGRPNVVVVVLR